jgi:hypothetical protein
MNQTNTPGAHGEPDAATSRKSGSAGGGEETTGRKVGTGASPPTQRAPTGSGFIPGRLLSWHCDRERGGCPAAGASPKRSSGRAAPIRERWYVPVGV